MIKVSTTGMVVSLKTDLWFPIPGQRGHGDRIIHLMRLKENYNISKKCSGDIITVLPGDEKKAQRILKYVLLKSSLIMELRNILQQICLTRQLPSQCFKNYIFIASL